MTPQFSMNAGPQEPDRLIETIRCDPDVADNPEEIGDSIRVAKALTRPVGGGEPDFFADAAARLLGGVVLYTIYKVKRDTGGRATLEDVVAMFPADHESRTGLYSAMAENTLLPGKMRHEWIAGLGEAFKGATSLRTEAAISETAYKSLSAVADPRSRPADRSGHGESRR